MLPRIKKIISVKPYKIICEWTNGEVRLVDFENSLKEWATSERSVYKKLLDKKVFENVKIDTESKTLSWENLLAMKDEKGNQIPAQLDFCPDTLYEMSKSLD